MALKVLSGTLCEAISLYGAEPLYVFICLFMVDITKLSVSAIV
jgi:hypothetical protein